jgi:hypothetical protein
LMPPARPEVTDFATVRSSDKQLFHEAESPFIAILFILLKFDKMPKVVIKCQKSPII